MVSSLSVKAHQGFTTFVERIFNYISESAMGCTLGYALYDEQHQTIFHAKSP
jgi:hypothetical protein